jgi:tripartite-type tricarboxylate transporter receptor subunit TctC
MPGAGGLKQANYIYNIAPKDGLHIGLMYDGIPTAQVLHPERGVKYDARKFGVLGSVNKGLFGIMVVLKTTGVKTLADAKKTQVITGSTGTASAQHYVPEIMNEIFGTRFKQIPGYKGTGEIFLAMERGELNGLFANYDTLAKRRPTWVKDGRLVWLAQLGAQRDRAFPKLPLLQELASKPVDKAVFELLAQSRIPGKIFITPPGVPADRLAALREAFAATMKDPAFKKMMKKIKKKVDPRSWQEAAALIKGTLSASPEVVARVRKFVKPRKRKKKKKKKKKTN